MITILMFLKWVGSGWIALAITLVSLVISLVVLIIFKENRNKKVILKYLVKLIVVLEVCDLIWFLIFFPNGEYYNYGLGGGVILLLFPLILGFMNMMVIVDGIKSYNKKDRA